MDAVAFHGFMQTLRAADFESRRVETLQSLLARYVLTAIQFGLVLDTFQFDNSKLEAAKVAAPRVVNPQHALGYAAKFDNSFVGRDYTALIAQQSPRP